MRYSSFRAGLWLVVAGLLPGGLNAGESLSQAWSKALATDAGLAAVSLDTEAARAGERAARAARLPQIEVGASYTRMADAPALSVVTPEFAFISPRIFDDDDFESLLSQHQCIGVEVVAMLVLLYRFQRNATMSAIGSPSPQFASLHQALNGPNRYPQHFGCVASPAITFIAF